MPGVSRRRGVRPPAVVRLGVGHLLVVADVDVPAVADVDVSDVADVDVARRRRRYRRRTSVHRQS